jgi:DNA primase
MSSRELFKLLVSLGLRNVTDRNNNIMACCPSHQENNPSWGISTIEPHFHGCFGCEYRGVLYSLLLKFGYDQAHAAEIAGQGNYNTTFSSLEQEQKQFQTLDYRVLFAYEMTKKARNYLLGRGVSSHVIKKAHILFDHIQNRVLFPWYYHGLLLGLTGRTVLNDPDVYKTLPYFGTKKGQCLYLPFGKITASEFFLTEGEIDALKIASAGHTNVGALGFGAFTLTQRDLILNSGVTEVVCFFDVDVVGKRLTEEVTEEFKGKLQVSWVNYDHIPTWKLDRYPKVDAGVLPIDLIEVLIKHRIHNAEWQSF